MIHTSLVWIQEINVDMFSIIQKLIKQFLKNRLEALETIKEAEENKPIVSDEIYYEED